MEADFTTLRRKTISIILLTLLGLMILIYAFSQIILMRSFDQLEEQHTQENIERAKNALFYDIERLESVTGDWAQWDDSYNFVQNGNDDYIKSYLDPSTLANIRVNFIIFYNTSGHLVYGEGIDIRNKVRTLTPELFQNDIPSTHILLNHTHINSSIRGIIILSEGPVLIASRPITTSMNEGPIRGTLIMGSFLNKEEIDRLDKITHLSINFTLFNDLNNPDYRLAIQLISNEKPIFIQTLSHDIITGYILLNDIEGNPGIVIKTDLPREIHEQGQKTINYLLIFIILSGLVFGNAILMLLEKNVLSRLAFLNSKVGEIGTTGDHTMRISMTGSDELSHLAKEINNMLRQLEEADENKTKQLLLKEIYHRVKNNLQIIISLLNLQSQKTNDKNALEIFKDSQNRIKSMALVHEKLYKSKDLAGIDFKEYIQEIVNSLFHSYGINSDNIKLKIDISDIIMDLDTATPCGLIVTELVSNSLKHAFPAGYKGELTISLTLDNSRRSILIVCDNGIGFPEEIDFRKTDTLGMQLVVNLVNQIKGAIELNRSNGTEFRITFVQKKGVAFEKS